MSDLLNPSPWWCRARQLLRRSGKMPPKLNEHDRSRSNQEQTSDEDETIKNTFQGDVKVESNADPSISNFVLQRQAYKKTSPKSSDMPSTWISSTPRSKQTSAMATESKHHQVDTKYRERKRAGFTKRRSHSDEKDPRTCSDHDLLSSSNSSASTTLKALGVVRARRATVHCNEVNDFYFGRSPLSQCRTFAVNVQVTERGQVAFQSLHESHAVNHSLTPLPPDHGRGHLLTHRKADGRQSTMKNSRTAQQEHLLDTLMQKFARHSTSSSKTLDNLSVEYGNTTDDQVPTTFSSACETVATRSHVKLSPHILKQTSQSCSAASAPLQRPMSTTPFNQIKAISHGNGTLVLIPHVTVEEFQHGLLQMDPYFLEETETVTDSGVAPLRSKDRFHNQSKCVSNGTKRFPSQSVKSPHRRMGFKDRQNRSRSMNWQKSEKKKKKSRSPTTTKRRKRVSHSQRYMSMYANVNNNAKVQEEEEVDDMDGDDVLQGVRLLDNTVYEIKLGAPSRGQFYYVELPTVLPRTGRSLRKIPATIVMESNCSLFVFSRDGKTRIAEGLASTVPRLATNVGYIGPLLHLPRMKDPAVFPDGKTETWRAEDKEHHHNTSSCCCHFYPPYATRNGLITFQPQEECLTCLFSGKNRITNQPPPPPKELERAVSVMSETAPSRRGRDVRSRKASIYPGMNKNALSPEENQSNVKKVKSRFSWLSFLNCFPRQQDVINDQ